MWGHSFANGQDEPKKSKFARNCRLAGTQLNN